MLLGHGFAYSGLKAFHREVIHMDIMFGVALSDKTHDENVSLETMVFLRGKQLKD